MIPQDSVESIYKEERVGFRKENKWHLIAYDSRTVSVPETYHISRKDPLQAAYRMLESSYMLFIP